MATSFLQVANRATTTLASTITADATSLSVASGAGALFPSSGTFHITIDSEILACTSRSSDTLTVTRAQLGTTAVVHTYDESTQGTEGLEGQRIYNVCPVIKLPSGCKGKLIEVKFENQKSSIDSFSVEFIDKGTR